MTLKLSRDVELALSTTTEGVVRLEGSTGTTYWVMTEEAMLVRGKVLQGLAQSQRQESEPWDTAEIIRDGREQLKHVRQR